MRGDIMRYRTISAVRRLIPVAGLLLATTLGGCVAYTGYPSDRYSYNNGYPGYSSAYPTSYGYSYSDPAYYPNDTSRYPPVYFGPFNPRAESGGNG
jgi:hypothetical protein